MSGFKKFNVREDFTENGFQWFHDAELLAAGDKAQALGLHTAYTANGTPYYTEATIVIECKIGDDRRRLPLQECQPGTEYRIL